MAIPTPGTTPDAAAQRRGYRCAFDIGGTFTDYVLVEDGSDALRIHKCLTRPEDPAGGAMAGLADLLAQAGIGFDRLRQIVHGSTLVTNLVIERKGAPTALLTTRGFRDIIELGTEQRYDVHDLFLRFPDPLVPRALRFEIGERVAHDGAVLAPLDLAEVDACVAAALAQGARALAVVFLHAYRNPAHERAVAEHVRARFPQLHVSLSSEVCGEIREYERATTTTANAYAQPLIESYLARLEEALQRRGFAGQFHLMQSSGTLASPAMARRFPIRLLESGPAGGGLAAAHFGTASGRRDVIAFDMGGTTAKVCLIQDGRPAIAPMMEAAREMRFRRGSGLPIRAPVIDMIEIGAGGGSIAARDELGLPKVGPRSAGADPGPAAYGRGGRDPTVTDANLLLGYLGRESFLGGRLALDEDAARRAFAPLADQAGGDLAAAAWGVFAVVCENMAGAARVHVVEKGCDPRRFTMVAFGGAGPAHAVRVAKTLGIATVLVPPASGAASAFGFLGAPLAHEATRSDPRLVAEIDWATAERTLAALEGEGRVLVEGAGIASDSVVVTREAEARLAGQVHTLRIAVPSRLDPANAAAAIQASFAAAYRTYYARDPFGGDLEIITWRVTCASPAPTLRFGDLARSGAPAARDRLAWFPEAGGFVTTRVHSRYALAPGARIPGPAIIEENESTTVIPPGDEATIDAAGNIVIAVRAAATAALAAGPGTGAGGRPLDPVSLEIMWSRLITISEECWQAVIRTAFSLIIGEAQDFACEILDVSGDSLAHSPRAMPVFNITLMAAAKFLLAEYPADTLEPGDVLVTNDPWHGSGHLFDVAVLTPVFRNGRVAAFVGAIGHVSDIGGTKNKGAAREIFEEGIQIPPMKLYAAGRPHRDLFRLLRSNVRMPRQVIGDIEALVAANALGARRLEEFMAEYGLDDLTTLAAAMHALSEKAARDAIRRVPEGTYAAVTWFNGGGERLWIPAKVVVEGDSVLVDYAGCPPQVPVGGINNTLPGTQAETIFALKCIFTPTIRATAGCYRAFRVAAPEGSLLNCSHPAAVALRRLSLFYVDAPIFKALSQAVPDQVQAFTGLPTIVDLHGRDAAGRTFSDFLFVGGGQGGSARHDGKTGMLWPTSAANTSIEMIEARIPVVIVEKSVVPDSAGAGRFRGGLGQRIRIRRLRDDGATVFVNVYPEGPGVTTDGLQGGAPGGSVRAFRRESPRAAPVEIEAATMIAVTTTDQEIEVQIGGGAGFGDPRARPRAAVREDLRNGYVTPAGARAYGVERGVAPPAGDREGARQAIADD